LWVLFKASLTWSRKNKIYFRSSVVDPNRLWLDPEPGSLFQ
jgi:hypothetical protein